MTTNDEACSRTTAEEHEGAVRPNAPKIQIVNACAFGLSLLLAIIAVVLLFQLLDANTRKDQAHERYDICAAAAAQLMGASDYLTSESQLYVVTGNEQYLNGYLDELQVSMRRDEALETLERESDDVGAVKDLAEALRSSNELAQRELYAMRLTAQANGLNPLPSALQEIETSAEDAALSAQEQSALAQSLLLGEEYGVMKRAIVQNVNECADDLIGRLKSDKVSIQQHVGDLTFALIAIMILLVVIIGGAVLANYVLVMRPMRIHARNIRENEPLEMVGSYELLYVVTAYNQIYDENHRRTMLLKHEAETDALTSLLNRGSYDKVLKHHGDDIALAIFDVDLFKNVNDTYGHNTGDEVLKKVAASIDFHFRTTDYVCRIGGDEFAVIMTEVNPSMRGIIETKLELIAGDLCDTSDGLPTITLSAGIAFSAEVEQGDNIYHAADKALYDAKRKGRNTHSFYGDLQD